MLLRFNPDAYDGRRTIVEQRIQMLAADINRVPHVGFYYYHSKARKHVDAALAANDSIIVFKAQCGPVDDDKEPSRKRRRTDAEST